MSYLCGKSFHQDSHEQIKQDIVAERHESDEIDGGPGGGTRHAVV